MMGLFVLVGLGPRNGLSQMRHGRHLVVCGLLFSSSRTMLAGRPSRWTGPGLSYDLFGLLGLRGWIPMHLGIAPICAKQL